MKKLGRMLFAFLGLTAGVASADVMPPPHDGARAPRIDVVNLLSLDATRAAQVETIMNGARQKMHTVHEQLGRPTDEATRATFRAAMEGIRVDTDEKLAAVLTPEEIARLHAAMPPPPRLEAMRFKKG
jgi:Spy/CpxP family protein refolding chaperone